MLSLYFENNPFNQVADAVLCLLGKKNDSFLNTGGEPCFNNFKSSEIVSMLKTSW